MPKIGTFLISALLFGCSSDLEGELQEIAQQEEAGTGGEAFADGGSTQTIQASGGASSGGNVSSSGGDSDSGVGGETDDGAGGEPLNSVGGAWVDDPGDTGGTSSGGEPSSGGEAHSGGAEPTSGGAASGGEGTGGEPTVQGCGWEGSVIIEVPKGYCVRVSRSAQHAWSTGSGSLSECSVPIGQKLDCFATANQIDSSLSEIAYFEYIPTDDTHVTISLESELSLGCAGQCQ